MKRHRLRNFALVVLVLLVIALVVLQIVLWSDWPRRIALEQAQRITGLRIDASSLSVGWLGGVNLRDVRVRLPLDDAEVLHVERINVKLPSLLWIALTQSADVKSVEVARPVLSVRQDPTGRWNVEQVVELLGGGGSTSPSTTSTKSRSGAVRLPRVQVTDGTVNVSDRAGKQTQLSNVRIAGGPDGPVSWKATATDAGVFKLDLVTATSGDWPHEATFSLRDVESVAKLWTNGALTGLKVDGTWTGSRIAGGVSGTLNLSGASLDGYDASGPVGVEVAGGKVKLTPRGLLLKTPQQLAPTILATGGSVQVDSTGATLDELNCAVAGGQALLGGKYTFADGAAGVTARFRDVTLPGEIRQAGKLDATLRRDWPGTPVVRVTLASTGAGPGVTWDGEFQLDGAGQTFADMDWTLIAPRLHVDQAPPVTATGTAVPTTQIVTTSRTVPSTRPVVKAVTTAPSADDEFVFPDQVPAKRSIVLDQLRADVSTRGQLITLRSLRIGDTNTVTGRGQVDLGGKFWWAYAQARDLPLSDGTPATAFLDVWGDVNQVKLNRAALGTGALWVSGEGAYIFDRPRPVDVSVDVYHAPGGLLEGVDDGEAVRGAVQGNVRVVGTLGPLDLNGTGTLDGRGVYVGTRKIGDLSIAIEAGLNKDEAWLRSDRLQLLGGRWTMRGAYPVAGGNFRLVTQTDAVPVQELALLAGVQDVVTGTLAGQWSFDIPEADVKAISMDGRFSVKGATYSKLPTSQPTDASALLTTSADLIEGRTTLREGRLRFGTRRVPIRLTRAPNSSVELRAATTLDDPARLTVSVVSTDWPVELPVVQSTVHTSMTMELAVALGIKPWADGPVQFVSYVTHADRHVMRLDADAALSTVGTGMAASNHRLIDVKSLKGDLLNGPLTGSAKVDLDRVLASVMDLRVTGIHADEFAPYAKMFAPLRGSFDLTANLAPATEERPIEPLKFALAVNSHEGRWRDVTIGNSNAVVYLNTDRAVLDRSEIYVADGLMRLWGRVSQPSGAGLATQVRVEFGQLDLAQLARSGKPPAPALTTAPKKAGPPLTGRLAGSITVAGDPRQRDRMFGQGTVALTNADLLDYPAVSTLYALMNVGFVSNASGAGRGDANLRLEGDTLELVSAHYYDRGVEIRATASVKELWSPTESPISGTAVGSPKPLADTKLPFLGELGDLLGAIASNAFPVRLTGTVQNPVVQPVPFQDVGEGLRKMLVGDITRETRSQSGP